MSSLKRKTYKVCLTGKPGVGKTSIYNAIRNRPFTTSSSATADTDFDKIVVNVNDPVHPSELIEINLELHDTAGMDRYRSLTDSYYRYANAIIMVFSLGCMESFQQVTSIMQDIQCGDYCPDSLYFLVGNKDDLGKHDLQVDDDTVYEFLSSKSWMFQKYTRTSAKERRGIKELFDEIANSLLYKVRPAEQRNELRIPIQQPKDDRRHCCS